MNLQNSKVFRIQYIRQTSNCLTSRIQMPCGRSPHECVVMNGHFVNPSRLSSSLARLLNIIDRVPIGDVRCITRSPRREAFAVITAWTCSKYCTSVAVPLQASVSIRSSSGEVDVVGISLLKGQYQYHYYTMVINIGRQYSLLVIQACLTRFAVISGRNGLPFFR